jgi:peptidoglycan-associated lipoprotein
MNIHEYQAKQLLAQYGATVPGGVEVKNPDEAKSTLNDLTESIKAYGKAVYIEIEGHTDNTGTDAYNYTLGLRRATAVRDYMHQVGGIPLHAMNTISFGESSPVSDNSTSTGRSQNRRVVVRVLE